MTDASLLKSEQAKERGMQVAASNKAALVQYARQLAAEHPLARLGITMDDVVESLVDDGKSAHCLGGSAGSLFKGRAWVFTGERRRSTRVNNHARELKVWRYIGG